MKTFFEQFFAVAAELAPWLFLGLGVAGLLHVLLPPDLVRRHLGRSGFGAIFKAAALGVPLPLCSCGVIPATVGLKKDGASNGACTAFLVSTPQTGVDSLTVSAAFLGWPFTLFKLVAALVTGLLAGWLVDLTEPAPPPATGPMPPPPAAPRRRGCRATLQEFWAFAAQELLGGMWHWILLGIVVSALLSTVLPPGSFAERPWLAGPWGLAAMLAIALPLYVCATGSVPIAAALIAAGLPPGAALVFLMAGPASNAATIGAIWKTFGHRVTLIYLGVIIVASLTLGYAFSFILKLGVTPPHSGHLHGAAAAGATWGERLWGTLLLAALAAYALRGLRHRLRNAWPRRATPAVAGGPCSCGGGAGAPPATHAATEVTLAVEGLSCGRCGQRVEALLLSQPGVSRVHVDLARGTARISGAALQPAALCAALATAGYPARPRAPE